jgi:hypothetical protein
MDITGDGFTNFIRGVVLLRKEYLCVWVFDMDMEMKGE